jgi:SAM-dependent methyltransferase
MDEFQRGHWWYRGRRYIARTIVKKYSKPANGPVSFLDIGCGVGEGSYIVPRVDRLVGIDESSEALLYAKGKGYTTLVEGSGEHLPFSDAEFQGIIATDVIEHIEDDEAALRECFRVLRPKGIFLITVPAYEWLWSGHDELFGHKRRYLKRDLLKKAREAGFEILFDSYYVTFLFPIIALIRLLVRQVSRYKKSSHFFWIPQLVNEFLFWILMSEGNLLRWGMKLPFGSSIIVVARKR